MLSWDPYKCHIEVTVKKSLATKSLAIVSSRCKMIVQAPEVWWNKTFKANCTEKYDDCLAAERINNEVEADDLKVPPRKEIIK